MAAPRRRTTVTLIDEIRDRLVDNAPAGVVSVEPNGRDSLKIAVDGEDFYVLDLRQVFDDDDDYDETPVCFKRCGVDRVVDHFDLLSFAVASLADASKRSPITGMSIDGDHKDCEAMFYRDGASWMLRVRPGWRS